MKKEQKYTCVLCKEPKIGFGNNPEPLAKRGQCCDKCNEKVITARIEHLFFTPKKNK
jgi:hypothetical protein